MWLLAVPSPYPPILSHPLMLLHTPLNPTPLSHLLEKHNVSMTYLLIISMNHPPAQPPFLPLSPAAASPPSIVNPPLPLSLRTPPISKHSSPSPLAPI